MDSRLHQHIDKGTEDYLFISSVSSSQNLWALIMDAGTGFTAQVYELSPVFLHKVCAVGWQSRYSLFTSGVYSLVCVKCTKISSIRN